MKSGGKQFEGSQMRSNTLCLGNFKKVGMFGM